MGTDLTFFETSVPVVPRLYAVFTAVGWGVLIGNLAFQSLKAMMAGLGFETESPAVLLIRTALFGTLIVVSGDICAIALEIGGRIISLLGLPAAVRLTLPDESFFTESGVAWLLVIIIGFILGFQLLRFFFEIAERYVVLGVLTLLMPVALGLGGSRSTKDICTGFMRTYASMTAMMVLNVLFLKLIISALSTIPAGYMIIPWCLLIVGIARTAKTVPERKEMPHIPVPAAQIFRAVPQTAPSVIRQQTQTQMQKRRRQIISVQKTQITASAEAHPAAV